MKVMQIYQEHGRSLENDEMILLLVLLVFELIPSKIHHSYILNKIDQFISEVFVSV